MTNKELQNSISQVEKQNIEFKQSFNKQAIETIVAFSNTKGGKILIGVSDSGNITGVKINRESLQNWQNEIKLKTQPSVFHTLKLLLSKIK